MRGHVEVPAGSDPPAWWDDGGVEVAAGVASLRAVESLARVIRAERAARAVHERCAADGYRRLVQAVLDADAATPEGRTTMAAETGRRNA